ncbi:unnamed protein product [Sphagnum troendelagicum]|uniref:Exostosin GT47 domain-containing protein n=1 Tax=Sphagnum troendelagicum TaxID=128251 RepID=A0ABP0UDU6_9BRYO
MTAATEPDSPSSCRVDAGPWAASVGYQQESASLPRQVEPSSKKNKTSSSRAGGARHSVTLALVICIFVASYSLLDIDDLLLRVQTSLGHIPSPTAQTQQLGATISASEALATAQCQGGMQRNSSTYREGPDNQQLADEDDDSAACVGRRIYIYKLPPQFNQKLIENCENQQGWARMCYDLSNQGLGVPFDVPESDPLAHLLVPTSAWYKTNQFSLELLFHERLKRYPCLTENPDRATMSYIPFYSALDLTPKLFEASVAVRDQLSERLVGWLQSNSHWEKSRGNKHVMVLGRIVWDYVRPEKASQPGSWGNALVSLPEFWNVTKISIERNPWGSEQMAVPYPTSFHPSSDAEMVAWQSTIRTAQRDKLVVFVGSPRHNKVPGTELRYELVRQCSSTNPSENNNTTSQVSAGNQNSRCTMVLCNVVKCARNPQAPIRAFLESIFCLQPPGDSATRKSLFDCLLAGAIPVLFDNMTAAQQYQWHLPRDTASYAITIDPTQVVAGELDVANKLLEVPKEVIATMQATIIDMLPRLIYKKPGPKLFEQSLTSSKDAFDHTIDRLLQKFDAHETV